MPREKKDGKFINLYIRKDLYDRLDSLCKIIGTSKTFAIEKGLELYLEKTSHYADVEEHTR